ncbi:hypothetical protein C2I19_11225 [Chromobacterium alticapitis]|uniref:Oxalate Biosynthetic Component A N-terminal domain-containing protein n=2 Tax=Chromobacterium alticapitis TaxID=2073169 RepID=A0A2S5DFT9_9NEIS|nr:hypothetical protein C2I19_11225 [Chromobacterium alticapitis]
MSRACLLPRALLESLSSRQLQRQLVLLLTTFGWECNMHGDLEWRLERLSSYLPADMVEQIRSDAPAVFNALLEAGWGVCEPGLWQPGKARSPHLPLTTERIVSDSTQSALAGAAVIHLHTRDMQDLSSLRIPGLGADIATGSQRNQIVLEQYEDIVPAMRRAAPETLLNLSTSARGDRSASQSPLRRAHLKPYAGAAAPEIASLSPGAVVFQVGGGYDNPNAFLAEQLRHFRQAGVRPEIEVFNHTITENAVTLYRKPLEESGLPVLFMLVAGVDQHRRDPVSGELDDDSLIGGASRKEIAKLLLQEEETATAAAARLAADQLRPTVETLRRHFLNCRISLLFPGAMHAILADVAIALQLDGIRVGLEDGLNLLDPLVPGGIRKARGTAEQVKALRLELEDKGYRILSAEEVRRDLDMRVQPALAAAAPADAETI